MDSNPVENSAIDDKAAARAQIRQTILDHASALLTEHGPDALTMRKLSQRVGASTIVLYTHFRDKQEILNELYLEGFRRLRDDLGAAPRSAEALDDLMALGRAYRRSATTNPTYYQIMFTRCVPGFAPAPQSRETSQQAFAILEAGVQRCLDEGKIVSGDANEIAHVLWGALHGLVGLELFGYIASPQAAEARLDHAIAVLRVGLSARSA